MRQQHEALRLQIFLINMVFISQFDFRDKTIADYGDYSMRTRLFLEAFLDKARLPHRCTYSLYYWIHFGLVICLFLADIFLPAAFRLETPLGRRKERLPLQY